VKLALAALCAFVFGIAWSAVVLHSADPCDPPRHCADFADCDEARAYLDRCPASRIDGDRDGIPCEALCQP